MKKKVSVIIPTYKRSDVLARAVNSVLKQTYNNIEIIVVDDNDPNSEYRKETELVMQNFSKYKNIIYLKHSQNKNGSAARNSGIKMSTGNYIAFLDDDDEFLPNKIDLQVKRLEELDNSWGATYTEYKQIENNFVMRSKINKEGNLLIDALARNLMLGAGSNLLVRKEVIEDIGLFDESFSRNQDIEFLVRVLKKYKIACVNSYSLIIHREEKATEKVQYEQYIKNDERYLYSFKDSISSLTNKEQKYIYDLIALQRFKFSVMHKNIIDGIKNLKNNNVSFLKTIHFSFYILKRTITKKSYGFKVSK